MALRLQGHSHLPSCEIWNHWPLRYHQQDTSIPHPDVCVVFGIIIAIPWFFIGSAVSPWSKGSIAYTCSPVW